MVARDSPARVIKERHVIPPDQVPTFYVNSVNFEVSNWDVKMRMGLVHSGDASVLNIAETLRVYMSQTHARAFAQALNTLIEKMDEIERVQTAERSPTPSKAH